MTLAEIAEVAGGSVADPADAGLVVSGEAYLDSRTPVPGGLFVAIAGERVDGHDYAAGAHAVLGSRPTVAPTVVVEDPVAALGLLARELLGRLDATLIALTGSQGKTGTKDYLAGALAAVAGADAVVATAANNNNELGVPLTVLRARRETRYVVVEMGARGVGHIAYLCRIAPPRVAAVINVGTAHIGEFGSREAIAVAKGEIVEALPDGAAGGVAVLNADDPLTAAMAERTAARVLTFGERGALSWRDLTLDALGRPSFTLVLDQGAEGAEGTARLEQAVTLRQPGAHQVANAAAAAALAVGAGVPFAAFARALGDVAPASRWRMEVTERPDGLVVVNDAYNANPESMRAALEALVAIGAGSGRRTVAVLGEMKELGASHEEGHRAVGAAAVALGVDVVLVVGEAARGIADGAAQAPAQESADGSTGGPEVATAVGHDAALEWLRQNAGPEDVVLVKASRGARLERIAAALLAPADLGKNLGQEGSTT
ncbi:UDP-N-acetylmuramoyl-tripeptide--D-alanyl-D-alanine ligase [Nocardioides sp. GY 10113]|uniref:UDP-N-acetylmuramoyl-tripeptide--D-alanyl-D- alanine ligase n=1 Tax=Nocardioides sp. GY 10113 TaxID=2569761 RepID=UPI001F0DBCCA|nr:UDP-N-acetylmuramoyl-tripeptide--D-alanyl-D-alanine ligase [Nocardioides sp. GY 10113]